MVIPRASYTVCTTYLGVRGCGVHVHSKWVCFAKFLLLQNPLEDPVY